MGIKQDLNIKVRYKHQISMYNNSQHSSMAIRRFKERTLFFIFSKLLVNVTVYCDLKINRLPPSTTIITTTTNPI
jgi:hypothetical protein